MNICKRIKHQLAEDGRSVMWLSKQTGIPYKTLYSALQSRIPRADTYALICHAMGVGYDYFLTPQQNRPA